MTDDDDSDDAYQPDAPHESPRDGRRWLKPLLFFAIALACGVIGSGLWLRLHPRPVAPPPSSDTAVTLDPTHRPLPAPMAGGTTNLASPSTTAADAPHIVSAAPDAAASPSADSTPSDAAASPAEPAQETTLPASEPVPPSGDSDAQVIERSPPPYPIDELRARVEGEVHLQVSLDAQGKVVDVRVTTSSGNAALDRAATDAVRNWRYKPAIHGGQAVAGTLDVPVDFRLDTQD